MSQLIKRSPLWNPGVLGCDAAGSTNVTVVDEESKRSIADYVAGKNDVAIICIQTDPPDKDQLGVKRPTDEAEHRTARRERVLGDRIRGQYRRIQKRTSLRTGLSRALRQAECPLRGPGIG